MRKIMLFLAAGMLLTTLAGCTDKGTIKSPSWEKQDLQGFKIVFSEFAKEQNIKIDSIYMNDFCDITPQKVFEETGCQIFKNRKTFDSYLLCEGKLYALGIGFGGLGVVDIETSDFDNNGKRELLYSYSWGSGLHRSCIGYFDLSLKNEENIDISSTLPLGYIGGELVFKKISNSQFEVYTASAIINEGNFANLTLKRDKLFGEIKAVEKKPVFFVK